jgi:predicted PurR-regulated permease PerM
MVIGSYLLTWWAKGLPSSSPGDWQDDLMMSSLWGKQMPYLALSAAVTALFWLLFAVRALVGPLIIAAILAYVLYPAVTWVKARTRLGQGASASLVYALFLVSLTVVPLALGPRVLQQAKSLSLELQQIALRMEDSLDSSVTILGIDLSLGAVWGELQEISSAFLKPDNVFRVIRAASANLAWVVVILVTTYHLLRDWDRLKKWLISKTPEAIRLDLRHLHREIEGVWQAYLRGQLLLMLVVGLLTGLTTAAVGLRGALVLGLLAGALDLIPSLGPIAVTAMAASIAWFEGSTYLPVSNGWVTVTVIALYALVQFLQETWLRPRTIGCSLRLHPGLVFVVIVGALALGGATIALIAVPLLCSAIVVGRYVCRNTLQPPPGLKADHLPADTG